MGDIVLRDVQEADLPLFFVQESDLAASRMAAFVNQFPPDHATFMAHWHRILADPSVFNQTIVVGGQVAGNIISYTHSGQREVGYWLQRAWWGRGIATEALRLFLTMLPQRPLYAHAAKDNYGSLRVLQKCGFVVCDQGMAFANARGHEIEEYTLVLGAPHPAAP